MEKMVKTFTMVYAPDDFEGRYSDWCNTKSTYEEAVKKLSTEENPWFSKVAIVEKTFDPETFTVSTKFLKVATRDYKGRRWRDYDGSIEETVYEN